MKRACIAALVIFPLSALAVSYPVDLEQQLNGAEVLASPETIDRDMAGLVLQNFGERQAECTTVFRNGPEAPRTRKITLQPGETKPVTAKFQREVIRLRIKLSCQPR